MSAADGVSAAVTTGAAHAAASSAASPNVSCGPGSATHRARAKQRASSVAIGEVRGEPDTVADPELPDAVAEHVLGRTGSDKLQRPGLGRCRGGVEQLAQPLLAGQAPGVQDMVATGDLRAGTERRVKPEPERHRRVPSRVGRRIDDRHHGVDLEVGAAVPVPERPLVDALGSGQAAGVKRGGGVVHGDHGGAAGVGGATRQARRPVGIVEQHDVRGECARASR